MAVRQFVGARYITKFADPIEWDDTRSYEAIECVVYQGTPYVSKSPVPKGVQITDTRFWLKWADPNADFEQLRQTVDAYKQDTDETIEEFEGVVDGKIAAIQASVNEFRSINRQRLNEAIIGHRGVNQSAPGDTPISLQLAAKWGYKFCEIDVQRTSDNEIVVHHSVNMSETCADEAEIPQTTLAQLQTMPYTKGNNIEMFPTQYLPTLRDMLLVCQANGIMPLIEVKTESFDTKEQIQLIMDIVRECGYWRKCYMMTFSEQLLTYIREINPYAFLIDVRNTVSASHIQFAIDNDIDGFAVNVSGLSEGLINTLRDNGFMVIGWNTETPGNANALLDFGVDAMIIDDITCFNRPSSSMKFPFKYGHGGIVDGVPTFNAHEYASALNGGFTSFIWRNPLELDQYGAYACIKRNTSNGKYCGTVPKVYPVGTVIKFKQNPYYQYSALIATVDGTNPIETGWIVPSDGDKFAVVSARDDVSAQVAKVSVVAARQGLPNQYNSEYMYEHAAQYMEVLQPLQIQFGALNLTQPEGVNPSPQLSRLKSARFYSTPGKVLNLAPQDDVRIAISGMKSDGTIYQSGWITQSNKGTIDGYDTTADTLTLPSDVTYIGFVWSKSSGSLGPNDTTAALTILKDNFDGLTLPTN